MKKISCLFVLLSTLIIVNACGDKSSKKKDNAIAPPTNNKPSALDTSLLPKAIFNFTLSSEKCQNILTFVENYQRQFLPKMNLIIDGDCSYSSNQGKIFRSVEFHDGDNSIATVQFALDYTDTQDIDKKPRGELLSKWSANPSSELLGNLAATFTKWVDENSLTGREACEKLQISAEDCIKKSQLPAVSTIQQ